MSAGSGDYKAQREQVPRDLSRLSELRALIIGVGHEASELRNTLDVSGCDATVTDPNSGVEELRRMQYDVVLVCLPNVRTALTEILKRLIPHAHGASFVIVGEGAAPSITPDNAIEQHQVMLTPGGPNQIVTTVLRALVKSQHSQQGKVLPAGTLSTKITAPIPRSAVQRWADYMFQASTASVDLRTLDLWAHHVGASYTTLSESCRLIGVRPHAARDLARALSAAIRADRLQCAPTVLLNIADSRTLKAFIRRAGRHFEPIHDRDALHRFLESQQFVDPDDIGMRILREQLSDWLTDRLPLP